MRVAVMGFALLAAAVLALLALVHRYVWRRFVGDTTTAGSPLRRAGTVAAYVLPLLSVGALVSGRTGAPFWLQQVLAWPGYLWLAALLYLTLALLAGEAVRPLLRRLPARRAATAPEAEATETAAPAPEAEAAPAEPVTAAHGSDTRTAAPPVATPLVPADPSRRLFVARAVGAQPLSPGSA